MYIVFFWGGSGPKSPYLKGEKSLNLPKLNNNVQQVATPPTSEDWGKKKPWVYKQLGAYPNVLENGWMNG